MHFVLSLEEQYMIKLFFVYIKMYNNFLYFIKYLDFLLQNEKLEMKLSHIIVARFSYSQHSVIPDFFARDTFGQLCLPKDLGLLIGRLHGVTSTFSSFKASHLTQNHFECSANLDELNAAINDFQNFNDNNPNWIETRFVKNNTGNFLIIVC